jgi:replicative DNA helicase
VIPSPSAFEAEHLPWNLDAEKATLGALLVRNEVWREVADAVAAEDFYREGHRVLFGRMAKLVEAGRPVDLVTLTNGLDESGLQALGGFGYLNSLTAGLPRSTNAAHYAAIVREHARRRQCIALGQQLIADAQSGDDIDAARAACEQALRELEIGRSVDTAGADVVAVEAFDFLETMGNAPDGITGVRTGLAPLDTMTGGLQPSELHIVAARPSVGKTALMAQIALHAAVNEGVPTVVVTMEQPRKQLLLRMASNMARVDLVAVRRTEAYPDDLTRLSQALERLAASPLTFIDHGELRMSDVRARARRLHAQGKCGYLLLDYLGLVAPERSQSRSETREERVSVQSRMAKGIAKELGIPFVLLCQLNREYEKDNGARAKSAEPRRPRLSDLRESGAIEQDADTVMFVHRPFVRPRTEVEAYREPETELIVAKQRNGPIGTVPATYTKEHVRFEATT